MTAHVEVIDAFAMVPEALVYDTRVSATGVRVYAALHRHGSDPSNCYPSLGRLAGLLGASRPSVKRWIVELEESGWIERVARFSDRGDQTANGYRLCSRWPAAASETPPGGFAGESPRFISEPGGGVTDEPTPGSPVSPQKESHRNESNKNETRDPSAPSFDTWWTIYPLKKAKGAARKAFAAALKKTTVDELIAGAERYRDDPTRKPGFTAYPATWLTGERWDDEQADAAPAGVAYATDPSLSDASARGGSQWA